MTVGRPLKYTVEDVEKMIDTYFATTPKNERTITGLAIVFGSKQLLSDYEGREGYSDLIKLAKLKIENLYEQALRDKNPTGSIFALKNMGWTDKQSLDLDGKISINKPDLSKLTEDELRIIADLQRKAGISKA